MKLPTLTAVALVSMLFLGLAGTATAQTSSQNLRSTAPYKSLKNYVSTLHDRSTTPTTVERKQLFRNQLAARRKAAATKAKALFTLAINRIKRKDDKQERAQVKQIRQNQKAQVQALNDNLAAQLRSIAAQETVAVGRVNARFAKRINPIARERAGLKRQLDRTRNPVRRASLIRRLNALQDEINALYRSKNSALAAVEARFNSRSSAANNAFSTRIKNAKASAKRQILQARRAWKSLFREEYADAKEKRADNLELISDLREAGAGYIQQMPLLTLSE